MNGNKAVKIVIIGLLACICLYFAIYRNFLSEKSEYTGGIKVENMVDSGVPFDLYDVESTLSSFNDLEGFYSKILENVATYRRDLFWASYAITSDTVSKNGVDYFRISVALKREEKDMPHHWSIDSRILRAVSNGKSSALKLYTITTRHETPVDQKVLLGVLENVDEKYCSNNSFLDKTIDLTAGHEDISQFSGQAKGCALTTDKKVVYFFKFIDDGTVEK